MCASLSSLVIEMLDGYEMLAADLLPVLKREALYVCLLK